MPRPRSPLRLRAALLAPLTLLVGCFPALEGAPCEADQHCPSSQFCSNAGRCTEGRRPQRAATMGLIPALNAATVSVGQSLTLTVRVQNTGTIILNNLRPSSVTSTGTATGTVLAGPTPSQVGQLLPGATADFTWTVQPGSTGALTFGVAFESVASDNDENVTASSATAATAVQRPASLEITSLTGPTSVSRGQTFAVTMVVTNRGEAAAILVAPTAATITPTGGASATEGASPAAAIINGGATGTFQLTFTENGTASGALQVRVGATGRDANSGADLSAAETATTAITVQQPAALSVTSFTLPAIIARGDSFAAALTVANTGEAAANMVLPSPDPPAKTATGGADAVTSTALSAVSIPGGESRTFTWNYTESGTAPGTLQLRAGVAGADANTGQAIAADPLDSNTAQVQSGGALTVTSFTIPTTLSRGQGFNAVMVVSNTGGSTVDGVLPDLPTVNATGGAGATTSSTFTAVSIAPGASHTFTFTYAENGTAPGTLSLTSRATGTDSASGDPVQSAPATTPAATVQAPAALSITAFTLPSSVSRGQTFTASLTVANTGEAAATGVLPAPNPPAKTTTGGADATTSGAPAAQTIAGGASATFTWTYTENGTAPGTFRLSAGVSGTDANTGGAISAPTTDSNTTQVEAPAVLQVTSFTIDRPAVVRGGTFTANMMVANTGGAAASVVIPSPSPPAVTATGGADASSSTTLAPVTIAGGASTTFSWSFTETGTGAGTLALSTAVTGQDANSGAPLSVPTVTSNTISVQTAGDLLITDFSFPTTLSRGQAFTLSMTVQNTGGSTVTGVAPLPNPPTLNATGQASASTATSPPAADIAPGATHTFAWSYTEDGTGPGTLSFTGAARGTDSVGGGSVTAAAVTTATATVQAAPNLTVSSLTLPPTLSRGQTFTVQMVVSNSGEAAANNVLPSPNPPALNATGQASAATTSTPAAQNIPGGGSATFTWTYTEDGTGTGTLAFTGGAAGTDANAGTAVSAAAVTSSSAAVQTPAALAIQSFTIPSVIQRGTTFNASLTVQNTGQAAASLVLPSPNPPAQAATGGAGATTSTTLTPVTIAGGSTQTFVWSYTESGSGPGTLRYQAGASGTDANSGASLSAASASTAVANVQDAAALEVTSFTLSQGVLSIGQAFTASITVRNRGGTAANAVLPFPDPPTVIGTGGAGASTSTALTPVTLAPGAEHTFTWAFTESGGPGTLQLAAGATGTDAVSGGMVTASTATTAVATVQAPATLAITAFNIPSNLSRGQQFIANMTVSNTGQAAANNVLPVPLQPTATGTGGASASSSTAPAAQNIPGGGSATFAWTYTENGTGAGTLLLNGGAQGTDANSGGAATAAATDSNTATVQQPAALSVTSFTAAPATIMRGSGFTLTMVVSNTGQATATGVLPSPDPPSLTPAGSASASTGTAQTPATIPGGGSATFTWSYTEDGTGAGTLGFAAGATGTDANTGVAVSAASASSNSVAVQAPPNLVVTSFTTSPTTLSRGQSFFASLTVQNQGGTQANGVLPSPNPPTLTVVSGSPSASVMASPPPADIAPGASHTFTFGYAENGTGPGAFTLTAGASGTNAVTGTTVTAPALTTAPVTVQQPASLSITSFTIPASIPTGSTFTAQMTVTNTGEATASGVVPAPLRPTVNATGSASAATSTDPAAQDIPGGGSVTFSWSYTETGTGAGTITLNGGASGADANSGAAVSAGAQDSTSGSVPLRPRDVETAISVRPRIAIPGETVTVTMEVKNPGLRPVEVAAPEALALDGPAEVALVRSPSTPAAMVAPGKSERFEWQYQAARRGWVTFSGAAGGGAPVTSSHLTVPAPWCATSSSLLAFAGPERSGRCNQPLPLGGAPSATGGAGLYRYEWSPGDGLSSPNASHPTAAPRAARTEYQLTVTDADGCQATDSVQAQVTDAPWVELAMGAAGDRLRLSRTLQCPAGGCADRWELGDGRVLTSASPVVRYQAEGRYTVRYRTTDASGCAATAELPVTIGGAEAGSRE